MKTPHYLQILTLLLITICLSSCEKEQTREAAKFETTLIPSIQVKTEPRLYNLEDRMKHYHVPGIQVAIVENGELTWNKGYGISRSDSGTPVDENTIFQAGSISKSITAFMVMKLVERRQLDLDKDVSSYLKTWKLPESRFTQDTIITLRMLLSHTSGMNNSNHPGFPQDGGLPSMNMLLDGFGRYKKADFDTVPGVRYKYSNTGYAVVQKVMEDVVGKPFQIIAEEEVFKPLKMTRSTFVPLKYSTDRNDISYAYDREGNMVKGYWWNAAAQSSGGLWTTAEDLAKFLTAFQKVLRLDGAILKENANTMITRVKANYGLGFDLKNKADSIVFYHTGKNKGFTNIMMASKKGGNAVIVLTNGDNGGYLFSEIVRGVSQLKKWNFLKPKELKTVDVSRELLQTYTGTYQLILDEETYTLRIDLDGDYLKLIDLDEDNKTYPLRALSDTKFRDIDEGEKVDFLQDENGKITLLWDEEYKFKKIE